MSCYLQVTPTFGENAVTGRIPGAWVGVDLPRGNEGDWLAAPVGSIYVHKPDEVSNPRVFIKRTDNGRDDDWGNYGGIHCIQQRVSYADFTDGGAAAGTLDLDEKIPVGAYVLRAMLENVEAFGGQNVSDATIQVGDGSDADRYNSGTPSVALDLAAVDLGPPSGLAMHVAAATIRLTVTESSDFTSITKGAFTFKLFYLK